MTRKVIYVSYMRLTDKVSRDWYIDYLITKGVTVEYWDLVPLLRGELDEFGAKTTPYSRTLRTYSEVVAMLRRPENRDAFYVMLIHYDGYVANIFRLMSKYDCRMLFIAWGALPIKRIQKWRKVLAGSSNPLLLAKKLSYNVKAIAYRKLKLVKPFDIVFAAGQVLMTSKLYATKMVPINLVDYDHFKRVKCESERLLAGRYVVFLDIFLPYHSDLKLVGMRTVNPTEYYASLNRFFELLELRYGLKVVVAAHPKADYSVEVFNGREIFHGRTPELVRDADFVIAHHSTALSYAVLNRKPLMFIYTNEMATLYKQTFVSYLRDFARYLDAVIYNVDKMSQGDQIAIGVVDPKRYDDYKYSYLTSHESEYTLTQDIFWREINAI